MLVWLKWKPRRGHDYGLWNAEIWRYGFCHPKKLGLRAANICHPLSTNPEIASPAWPFERWPHAAGVDRAIKEAVKMAGYTSGLRLAVGFT